MCFPSCWWRQVADRDKGLTRLWWKHPSRSPYAGFGVSPMTSRLQGAGLGGLLSATARFLFGRAVNLYCVLPCCIFLFLEDPGRGEGIVSSGELLVPWVIGHLMIRRELSLTRASEYSKSPHGKYRYIESIWIPHDTSSKKPPLILQVVKASLTAF